MKIESRMMGTDVIQIRILNPYSYPPVDLLSLKDFAEDLPLIFDQWWREQNSKQGLDGLQKSMDRLLSILEDLPRQNAEFLRKQREQERQDARDAKADMGLLLGPDIE